MFPPPNCFKAAARGYLEICVREFSLRKQASVLSFGREIRAERTRLLSQASEGIRPVNKLGTRNKVIIITIRTNCCTFDLM